MLDLTVAIVSYNSGRVISAGLSSVMLTDKFSVVVVDNNSPDGSAEYLKEEYPTASVIKLDQNLGYGRAANVALSGATTRFILLLNPDIEVSDEDIADFYHRTIQLERAAVVFAPATSLNEYTQTGWHEVPFVLGAVMLFDMQQLQSHGFFDEQYFLFYEEKDLCFRIVLEGGEILRLSDIYFQHSKGTSSGSTPAVTYLKQWHVGWSSAYYLKKHGLNKGRFNLSVMYVRYLLKRLFSLSSVKRNKYTARLGGLTAFMWGKRAFDRNGCPRRLEILAKRG